MTELVRLNRTKALCTSCPVADECAEADQDEPAGIWAGASPMARQRLVRSSGRQRPPAPGRPAA